MRPQDAEAVGRGSAPWWAAPAVAAGTAIGGSILQYKLSKKNADTAHQREVKDLVAAGLNPVLSVMGGRGAPDPTVPDFGEGVNRSLANALSVQQARASIDLTRAQAFQAHAAGTKTAIESATAAGTQESTTRRAAAEAQFAELNASEKRQTLESAIRMARAELARSEAGAASLKARAKLDELAAVGAGNIAELEKKLGTGSPAALLVLKYLNLILR